MNATAEQLDTLAARVADEIVRHFDDRTTAWRFDGNWEIHFCETSQYTLAEGLTAPRSIACVSWSRSPVDRRANHAVAEIAWVKGEAPPLLASKIERILRDELPTIAPSQIVR